MKNRDNIYNVGNDYYQKLEQYFVTADEAAAEQAGISGFKAYSDGLYHFTTQPVYELSGGLSALNKRVFNKLPQSEWEAPEFADALSGITDSSAVFSPDYAKVEMDFETDNDWSKSPKGQA